MRNYYPFSAYLKERYGTKVRKVSLNAGFPCPNRTESSGCIFCNEEAFTRYANTQKSLREQLREAIEDGRRRWKVDKFMAYFQNSTSTNATLPELKRAYDVVLEYPEVVAMSISTRPDCVDERKLDLIAGYLDSLEVWVEYGMQSARQRSLDWLARGHGVDICAESICQTARRGINVGAHIILGIPGESENDMARTADLIAELPVKGVKLHLLHAVKNTQLERMYRSGCFTAMKRKAYVNAVCSFLERIPADRVVLRLVSDAQKDLLVEPGWMNEKMSTLNMIEREFQRRGTCQGVKCCQKAVRNRKDDL